MSAMAFQDAAIMGLFVSRVGIYSRDVRSQFSRTDAAGFFLLVLAGGRRPLGEGVGWKIGRSAMHSAISGKVTSVNQMTEA